MARRHPRQSKRGTTAIEYAIIIPAALLLIFGLIDTGRLLWTYAALYRATEAAARCAAVNSTSCGSATQIKNFAATQAWGLNIAPSAFAFSNAACGKQVSASYAFVFAIPGLGTDTPLGTISLTARACYPA